ncbi:MAG: hypothetical protein J1E85_02700 [Ruminococcus sp.]|nr:hypothetical protein [Ruminococcus sp.]
MNSKILVCYKSVTGFTKQYAEMIADEMDCTVMDFKNVNAETVSKYDTVVFGGRCYMGAIDGLKKAKALIAESGVKTFVVFATGATPNTAEKTIQDAWNKILTSDELLSIPHFYMQGGLCYEKMPLHDWLMMKAFAAVMKSKMKNKKDKTEEDREFERVISNSYDISSKSYIEPLVSFLKERK